MTRITTNALTGWAVALFVSYWLVGLFVPGLWLAIAIRIGLFCCGVAALWEWGPAALRLLQDRRGPAQARGDVLSLLGIATIAAGVTYSSVWGLTWYAAGSPIDWTTTPTSLFGSAMQALGLGLVYRSTGIRREVIRPVNWWIMAALITAVAAVAFVLGSIWQAERIEAAGPMVWTNLSARAEF